MAFQQLDSITYMVTYEKFTLDNQLKVILHQDKSTEMVVINVLYDVGAKDEAPDHTGFAHLFEHLMFGGSEHIPVYDEPLQLAGGENNAYTTNDITNYYIQIPKENVETALWLESDRMKALAFSPESLEVQRKVVCEEFKEHYINKPYGDAWKHLRALAFKEHPYQWMTIGKELSHIENATLEQVKDFFYRFYLPSNAILCVAGNFEMEEMKTLVSSWFEDIPSGKKPSRNIKAEPVQSAERKQVVEGDVPIDAIYKVYHIGGRLDREYYAADILSDILGSGKTAKLYHKLVKEQQVFSQIQAYQTGSTDPGLLVIEGKLVKGVKPEIADRMIEEILEELIREGITETELTKIKNKIEAMIVFEDTNLMNLANNLAFFELLGDADQMNKELEIYQSVSNDELRQYAARIFQKTNCSTLYYLARKTD